MELIADLFLVSGALGAGFYCYILGKKLNRFNSLENGVGGAVAVLSAQVDDLEKIIELAQKSAENSTKTLGELTKRAEETSRQLELQMASLHDIPTVSEVTKERPEEVRQAPPQAKSTSKKEAPAQAEPMFVRHSGIGAK